MFLCSRYTLFTRNSLKNGTNIIIRRGAAKTKTQVQLDNKLKNVATIKDVDIANRSPTLLSKLFGRYLLLTNTVSSGVLMVAGDLLSQELEYQRGEIKKRYDLKRLGQMFLVGSIQGPMHHYFYGWLAKILPDQTVKTVIKKILWDQVVMSPACIIMFFIPACLLENKSIKESSDELKRKFLTVYVVDWSVWPIAQFVNFYYLPSKYNVIFVNSCTMLYNVFMSYIKHNDIN